jgi:hypothetical protein
MTSDRICLLIEFFNKRRFNWEKSNCVFARELRALMSETIEINPKDNLDGAPCPLTTFNKERLADNLVREKQ